MTAERPTVETHLLLRLLGQQENGDVDWRSGPPWDWRVFADACDRHQVASLAFSRLNSLPEQAVPDALSAHLRDRFYKISLTNYLLANKLVALTSRLEQEDILVLAYKGPAVAMAVYGDLALREYQDLDLVVPPEHLPHAIELMARVGFRILRAGHPRTRRDRAQFHHATFHAPDQSHYVDLHWQLAGDLGQSFRPEIEKLWSRSETLQLPHGRISTMCREDLFLALCCHGTRHRWSRLKWLVDVAELLRSADAWNWSRIEELTAHRWGVGASASLGMLLARGLLGASTPAAARILPLTERITGMAEAIREEILINGPSIEGESHRTLLGLEEHRAARMKYRGTQAVRYTRSWLHHVSTASPKDRALFQLPESFEFLYPYLRLLRLVVKGTGSVAHALWSLARRGSIRKAVSDRL